MKKLMMFAAMVMMFMIGCGGPIRVEDDQLFPFEMNLFAGNKLLPRSSGSTIKVPEGDPQSWREFQNISSNVKISVAECSYSQEIGSATIGRVPETSRFEIRFHQPEVVFPQQYSEQTVECLKQMPRVATFELTAPNGNMIMTYVMLHTS